MYYCYWYGAPIVELCFTVLFTELHFVGLDYFKLCVYGLFHPSIILQLSKKVLDWLFQFPQRVHFALICNQITDEAWLISCVTDWLTDWPTMHLNSSLIRAFLKINLHYYYLIAWLIYLFTHLLNQSINQSHIFTNRTDKYSPNRFIF